jgi:hypothetical protein
VVEGEFFTLDHLEEQELATLRGCPSINQLQRHLALISEVESEGGYLTHSGEPDQDLITQSQIIPVKWNGCERDDHLLYKTHRRKLILDIRVEGLLGGGNLIQLYV